MSWPWLFDSALCDEVDSAEYFSPLEVVAWKVTRPSNGSGYYAGYRERATCQRGTLRNIPGRHPARQKVPSVYCTCGFYTWKTQEAAEAFRVQYRGSADLWRVHLSGVVIEHERGYRAEICELVEKIWPLPTLTVLERLGQGTTGEIRRATGSVSGNDAAWVRMELKAAAAQGLCVEIPTEKPNNHGGHLWLWTGSEAVV